MHQPDWQALLGGVEHLVRQKCAPVASEPLLPEADSPHKGPLPLPD